MAKYILKRLAQSLLTIFLVVCVVFLLMRLLPNDYYFTEEQLIKLTDEQQHDILEKAGMLDHPLVQLGRYLKGILLHGDFGVSHRIQTGKSVTSIIASRFGISMRLGLIALVFSLLIGVPSGILQARFKDGLYDHIGTAFTPLLTIGGSSKDGKRAALIHLYFNIIGSVILLALVYAVQFTIGIPMWGDVMNKSSIANIHTMTSVIAMLFFLPCSGVLSRLAMMTVPNSAEEAQELSMPVLDERLFKSPAVALQQAKNAVVKMSRRAARNVGLATPLLLKMDEDVVSAIDVRENLIDRMEVEISNYLIKLADQELGDAESHEVTELLNFVTECERIGDYAVNIKEKAQELTDKEVTFSEKAQQELKLLDNALEKILTLTTDAFEFDDARTASQVEPLEQVIDILVERLRAQHIKRLKDGACSIDTGVVYLDVLNNVERISDHCSNIAARLVGMEAGEDYDSHTLKNMMHHNPTKEYMLNYEQCRRDYLIPLEQLEA